MPESEFRVVKRMDVPTQPRHRAVRAWAKMTKAGALYFNVIACEALGNQDCLVLAEFDETAHILKFTVIDKPPRGITEADLFPMKIKMHAHSKRPAATILIGSLLRYIGFSMNGKRSIDFPIAALNAEERSISVVVPVEELCPKGEENP